MKNDPLYKSPFQNKVLVGALFLVALVIVGLIVTSVIEFSAFSLIAILFLVAAAVLAYQVHVKSLAFNTRQISEFSRVHLATVEALASAIDARDQVGHGHVRRTQIYAVGIGRVLGLSENEINALRTGALLHDIGKLAIPDHILNKPGALTAAELEKTKIHPVVGASILEKVGFDYPVVPTVKYHHECWDGRGYPEGLKGEQIPLTARILSVADSYDTLRGARPYRPPVAREKARQIILDGSGTRFDPTVVQTLIRNLGFIEAEVNAQGLGYGDNLDSGTAEAARGNQNYAEQIKLANREVFSLYELAREFSSSITLEETLEMFAKKVGEFVPYHTCALYLLDGSKKYATAMHVEGENSSELSQRRLKVGQGATGFVLKSGETVQNVDPDLDFSYTQVELTQLYSTMASVPLIADGELLGAVTIYSQDLETYGEENIRLLETISRIAADAIGKSLEHDEARTHALTDPMTGLPNARSLQLQFEKEVARSNRSGTSFQLLMLDLDGFKAVNDSFGHKVGDQMLVEIGQVILGQLRDYDFLARYGGDEFVALVPETGSNDVTDLCDRIEKAVNAFSLNFENDTFASVGVSLGASGYARDGETFDQMVIEADKAMYERKSSRKLYASMSNKAKTPELKTEVEDAVSSDAFIVELDESHILSSKAIN